MIVQPDEPAPESVHTNSFKQNNDHIYQNKESINELSYYNTQGQSFTNTQQLSYVNTNQTIGPISKAFESGTKQKEIRLTEKKSI